LRSDIDNEGLGDAERSFLLDQRQGAIIQSD
jgi:hypothetical protein